MNLFGYRRADGTIGIRNHVLILPTSVCASDAASQIAEKVDGTIAIHNQLGCSQNAYDQACTLRTLAGLVANSNVYGAIVISLGCENCQMDLMIDAIRQRTNKPLETFIIQKCGGVASVLDQAIPKARAMVQASLAVPRMPILLSDIILGTECGGSDPTSGLVANPLIGMLSDHVVDQGGTSILCETTEFIGAEHILMKKAKDSVVAQKIKDIILPYEESQLVVGENVRKRNPSPGNKAGGITTLEEKSLGCIQKAGHRVIENVLDYARPIDQKGLIIMDTPGNDPISMMGMAAGGCQIILFSTGLGTPLGNPIVPVIKISANPHVAHFMNEHIDLDASDVTNGKITLANAFVALQSLFYETVNGKCTKAEETNCNEIAIARVNKYVKNGKVKEYYY
ncbi:altronate dehydratase [Absicoccus porci]|jgi:altronate dehydratase large subunit|uniref:Altronate dehydratase n=1 Tax=Absicoccus porci TaxID=2486576 RepID=A0A3N0HYZ7_9FIRM|nr:UxaA family hydrolase [Absicoccus porci]RNM29440.1 altronate dehydratase [Absicoccus porci]